ESRGRRKRSERSEYWWRKYCDACCKEACSAVIFRERESRSDRGLLSMAQQPAGGDSCGRHGDRGAVHGALAIGGCAEARVHVYVAGDGRDADGGRHSTVAVRRKSIWVVAIGGARD